MAVKSIVEIAVNDAAFLRYTAAFKQYQSILNKTPNAWNQVQASVRNVAAAQNAMLASVTAVTRTSQTTVGMNTTISRLATQSAASWGKIATSTKSFAVHITTATRQLLRWASITGVISGLLGAGGLFGITRLAQSGASQRRSSLGLGSSAGQLSAFNRNYRPLVGDPQGLQEQVARSLNSPGNIELRRAGVTGDLTGKSTTEVTMMLVEQLKKIADSGMAPGTAISAYGLDKLGITEETLNNLRRRGAGEISGAREATARDSKAMNITDDLLKKWETLSTQLGRAADIIEAKFINALANLAPEIGKLSEAFTGLVASLLGSDPLKNLINSLTEEIRWLSTEMGRESFKKSVLDFIENVEKIAIAIANAVKWISSFLPDSKQLPGPRAGSGEGPSLGPGLGPGPREPTPAEIDADGARLFEGLKKFFFWMQGKGIGSTGLPGGALPMSGPGSTSGLLVPIAFRPPGWGTGGGGGFPGTGGTRGSAGPVGAIGTPGSGADGPGGLFARLEQSGGLPRGLLDSIWNRETRRREGPIRGTSGEIGPFQFMPGTWKRFGQGGDPGNLQDAAAAAQRYFSFLMEKFHGDPAKAIAGYNAGEGRVDAAVAKWGDRWRDHIPRSTQGYLGDVLPHVGGGRGGRGGERLEARGGANIYIFNNTGGNAIVTASALRA